MFFMNKNYLIKIIEIKCLLIVIILFLFPNPIVAQSKLLNNLRQTIDSSSVYDKEKLQEISFLKKKLREVNMSNFSQSFDLNLKLFDQYKVFKSDSAYYFSVKMKEIAELSKDSVLISKSLLKLADISTSVGMYKEAIDFLESIKLKNISREDRPFYYGVFGRSYSDMAEYTSIPYYKNKYQNLAKGYREKILNLTTEGSFFNVFMTGFNLYKSNQINSSLETLIQLLSKDISIYERALTHYILGEIYNSQHNIEQAEYHYIKSAICDIKTSTKESLAIIRLSELLFKKKEIELAGFLIQKAYEDAQFYGAQQRKLQVGAILPLIEDEILKNTENERKRLYWQYIIAISFSVILLIFILIFYVQFKRIRKAKKDISVAHKRLKNNNLELVKVNNEVKERNVIIEKVNTKLFESNKIKEEYLGFFFTEYDDIFEKFNDIISNINKGLEEEDLVKIKFHTLKYDKKKEKEKLLHNFDTAFINLFPNFINEFNELLKDEHKIKLKKNQILNKELRIFALIRLGIKHNEKIAQILGYSVNSIYAFKSKVRNNSMVENENFDKLIIDNTTIKS
ncbi:hypothetical protein GCM10011397_14950 [Wenyingzhuangia marina]|nr:hypothetical protein GCM10011397_14950 [Wenyingzhuangia marina]